MRWTVCLLLCCVVVDADAFALEPTIDDVYVRVVDVGAGHCAVVRMPGDHYMVYDAGNYEDDGATCFTAIQEIVPEEQAIDLMVLSHSDSDHLGAVGDILDAYTVRKVIRSGMERDTGTWKAADAAITNEKNDPGLDDVKFFDVNLAQVESLSGAVHRFGDTLVTVVLGYDEPPKPWGKLSKSEFRNAGSIVVRLVYRGRSILFTGDSVGRHIDDPPTACIAAEHEMVEMSSVITIDSDVLIAPHHGADNGSSTRFIEAVSPEFVVFPAGHKFQHPRKAVAERYLSAGISPDKMFRTDFNDDEGSREWNAGRISGAHDPAGDDDVDIILTKDGKVNVAYRHGS